MPILFLMYSGGLYATGPSLTFSKIIFYDVIILLLLIAFIHHFLLRCNFLKIGHCKSCNRFEAIKPISFFFWRRGNTKKQVTLGVKNPVDHVTLGVRWLRHLTRGGHGNPYIIFSLFFFFPFSFFPFFFFFFSFFLFFLSFFSFSLSFPFSFPWTFKQSY